MPGRRRCRTAAPRPRPGRPARPRGSPCASPRTPPARHRRRGKPANASPGCSSRPALRRGRRRAHRRRQVQQPARVDGEAAHHLQRRGGASRRGTVTRPWWRVETMRLPATSPSSSRSGSRLAAARRRTRRRQRLDRLVPDLLRGNGNHLALGIAQRGEPAAEDATGVQAHGPVHPLRVDGGRVAVEHHRPAAVVVGPRVAHRQAELVGLPGGVAVQREAAHRARRPAVVATRAARRARRPACRRRARSARPGSTRNPLRCPGTPPARRPAAPASRPARG